MCGGSVQSERRRAEPLFTNDFRKLEYLYTTPFSNSPPTAVSVPSVAGQPPCPHGPGNQNSAARPPIASFRGKTHRDDPSGVLRPNIIQDGSRSGRETPRLPELFQQAPRSFGFKRTAAYPEDAGASLNFASYRGQKHCRGLYQTPIAA